MRLAIEEWLWSGGKARTWLAIHLPKHISDAHYISPRKLRKILEKSSMDNKAYWMVDLDDTGSSVYPEARSNPWSYETSVDTERYVFGSSPREALDKAVERLKR